VVPPRSPRPSTVYECPSCQTRYLGNQYCPDCRLFCRRIGAGGLCPSCDEPVALADLFHCPPTGGHRRPPTAAAPTDSEQLLWPPAFRSHDRQRAAFVVASVQVLMTVDTPPPPTPRRANGPAMPSDRKNGYHVVANTPCQSPSRSAAGWSSTSRSASPRQPAGARSAPGLACQRVDTTCPHARRRNAHRIMITELTTKPFGHWSRPTSSRELS
jgi:hypothetical protein